MGIWFLEVDLVLTVDARLQLRRRRSYCRIDVIGRLLLEVCLCDLNCRNGGLIVGAWNPVGCPVRATRQRN